MRTIALLLCLLVCGGWSHGRGPQTYFVDGVSGSDSNDGLASTRPWQTIGKVNGATFNSGDTVAFKGGQTFSSTVTISQTNAPSNVTFTSFGVGQATFSTGNSAGCFTATNFPGFGINNITCVGGGAATNTTKGISVTNSGANNWIAGPKINNVTISGYGLSCIDVGSNQGSGNEFGFLGTTVSNNTAHDCTENVTSSTIPVACIYVGYDNVGGSGSINTNNSVFVTGNTAYNCLGVASIGGGSWTGGGIIVPQFTAGSISNNLVHDTGTNSGQNPTGLSAFLSNGAVVSFNEVYNVSSASNIDGQCIDASVSINEIVEYNYLHHCQNGDLLLGDFSTAINNNVDVRFNVLQGDTSPGIQASSCSSSSFGCTNLRIYNNTFAGATVGCGNGNSSSVPFSANFSNNIFYQYNGGSTLVIACSSLNLSGGQTITFTGNDYNGGSGLSIQIGVNTYTSLATFQAACSSPSSIFEKTGGCVTAVGTTSNPNLTGTFPAGNCGGYNGTCPAAYDLTSSSPAGKGNGLNLNSLYSFNVGTQDFYGNAVTNTTLPIGAAANQ